MKSNSKGLADTPFYVKLTKDEFKEAQREAKEGLDQSIAANEEVYRDRLDALVVAASLYDHNEEKVFTGELYDALGIGFEPIKAVGMYINYAEERVINAAALECVGFIPSDKARRLVNLQKTNGRVAGGRRVRFARIRTKTSCTGSITCSDSMDSDS